MVDMVKLEQTILTVTCLLTKPTVMKHKETPHKEGDAKQAVKPDTTKLKTEPPISEKDEVKKAEDKTRKATGRHL
jgi:hypothetical protein